MQRREFLVAAGSGFAAAALPGCSSRRSSYRLLRDEEAAILSVVCEQIIPTDDTPGASWANVVKFIDRQLVYHYQRELPAYRLALSELSSLRFGQEKRPFLELSFDQQTDILARMEKGEFESRTLTSGAQRDFFRMVRNHTMQGYYGDPRHGGNRDLIGWRILGVPYPPVRGRDDYEFPKERSGAIVSGGTA